MFWRTHPCLISQTVLELKSVVLSRYSNKITYRAKRAQMGSQRKGLKRYVMLYVTVCRPKLSVTVGTPMVTVCTTALNNYAVLLTFCVILKAGSHIACRAHAVPLPNRATKGLECVFPIWFTQCDCDSYLPCHAPTMPFFSRPQHGRLTTAVLWPWKERHGRSMAWAWHGKCESQSHCVNQMGKTF